MIMFGTKKYDERIKNALEAQGTYGGGVGADFTGFNPRHCEGLASALSAAYTAIETALSDLQTNFFDKLSEEWYSENAVTTMSSAQTVLNNLRDAIVLKLNSVSGFLTSAASAWQEWSGNACTPVNFQKNGVTTLASKTKSDNAGNVGAEPGAYTNGTTALSSFDTTLNAQLTACLTATDNYPNAFIGRSQMSSLISSLESFQTNLSTAYTSIHDDLDGELFKMDTAATTLAERVALAASGEGAGASE